MASKRSATFNHFDLEDDGGTYVCNIIEKDTLCGKRFSVKRESTHDSTRCFNLKRHLERWHRDVYDSVVKKDKEATTVVKKAKSSDAPSTSSAGTRTITSFFRPSPPNALKVLMDKEKFIKAIVEMVVYEAVPFSLFSSPSFMKLNGEMAQKLGINLNRESIRKYVLDAAQMRKEGIKEDLKEKFVYVKTDAATRLRSNYLGVNIQYFDMEADNVKIVTLGIKDTDNCHTSEAIKTILEKLFHQFGLKKENILACVVDNASNMTKTVEKLDMEWELEQHDEEELEEENEEDLLDEDSLGRVTQIHHTRCAVHTLQLAVRDGLKQQHAATFIRRLRTVATTLRTPHLDSIVRRKANKGAILDQATRWSSTYYMVDRLLILKPVVQDLGNPDTHLSDMQWDEAQHLRDLLHDPQVLTLKLQSDSLTPGQFFYNWRSVLSKLKKRGGAIAEAMSASMERRETTLLANDLLLAGIYVDARVRILLTDQQCRTAKRTIELLISRMQTQKSPTQGDDTHPLVTSTDDEDSDFEMELSQLSRTQQSASSSTRTRSSLEDVFQEMENLGRIKATSVWEIIPKYPQSIQEVSKILSAMPTTQASVERLFSALKILKSDRRASLKEDILDAILFLRVNKF